MIRRDAKKMKKKVIRTLVTILTLVAGGISIYVFVTGEPQLLNREFKGEEYFHSPWLGIEIFQGDEKVEMVSQGSYAYRRINARMTANPFMIRIPKRTEDDVVQICVWKNDSIFQAARKGLKTEEIPFFTPGTGIAGAVFSIPELYISNESHNYFRNERLEIYSESQHSISVSKFIQKRNEYHISKQKEPLYMVIFMDLNNNSILEHQESEYFVLDF